MIAMYLHLGTISPISLMELGLFIKTKKIVICCPDGFHRRGNIQVMCDEYNGKLVATLDELVKEVKDRMKGSYNRLEYPAKPPPSHQRITPFQLYFSLPLLFIAYFFLVYI